MLVRIESSVVCIGSVCFSESTEAWRSCSHLGETPQHQAGGMGGMGGMGGWAANAACSAADDVCISFDAACIAAGAACNL